MCVGEGNLSGSRVPPRLCSLGLGQLGRSKLGAPRASGCRPPLRKEATWGRTLCLFESLGGGLTPGICLIVTKRSNKNRPVTPAARANGARSWTGLGPMPLSVESSVRLSGKGIQMSLGADSFPASRACVGEMSSGIHGTSGVF